MINRLKPNWKVLAASVGLVGLGAVGAPTALASLTVIGWADIGGC